MEKTGGWMFHSKTLLPAWIGFVHLLRLHQPILPTRRIEHKRATHSITRFAVIHESVLEYRPNCADTIHTDSTTPRKNRD